VVSCALFDLEMFLSVQCDGEYAVECGVECAVECAVVCAMNRYTDRRSDERDFEASRLGRPAPQVRGVVGRRTCFARKVRPRVRLPGAL